MTSPLPISSYNNWYTVTHFSHDVCLISEQHIDPFYRCNIWYIKGRDKDLLVDSGMGVVSLCQCNPWLINDTKPILAVASHCHFDHIGNHHEFQHRLCHPHEAHILANPTADTTLAQRYAVIEMFTALPPQGFSQNLYQVPPAPATQLIEHGDVIDLGNRQFQVLHLPGHSPGSIALWEQKTGILFSGDAIYDGPLIDDAYHSNVPEYLDSLDSLRRLPIEIVHGGHFNSFGKERMLHLIQEYQAGKRMAGCPSQILL